MNGLGAALQDPQFQRAVANCAQLLREQLAVLQTQYSPPNLTAASAQLLGLALHECMEQSQLSAAEALAICARVEQAVGSRIPV